MSIPCLNTFAPVRRLRCMVYSYNCWTHRETRGLVAQKILWDDQEILDEGKKTCRGKAYMRDLELHNIETVWSCNTPFAFHEHPLTTLLKYYDHTNSTDTFAEQKD